MLRKMFGDAEIFLITALCTQKKPVEFVDCQNADRLDLFLRFLGITTYEQKHDLAKADLSSKQVECDGLKRELQGFEGEEVINTKIETLESDLEANQAVAKKQGKQIGINNKEIDTLRELVEALQVIELPKTAEELDEELDKETISLDRRGVLVIKQSAELEVAQEEWKLVAKGAPEDWFEDLEPETKILDAIEELRTELSLLSLKESTKTVEQWQVEKDKIAAEIEEKTLENLTFQTTIEAALVEKADIEEWEADTLEDLGLNKKINNAENQIENLQEQLDSEVCPICKEKRKDFDRAAIEKQIEDCKELITKYKATLSVNSAERLRLTNLQKSVSKARTNIKLNNVEFQKLKGQLDNIDATIVELGKNAKTKLKRDKILQDIETKKIEAEQIKFSRVEIANLQKKIATLVSSLEVLNTHIELGNNKVKEIKRDIKTLATNKTNRDKRELLKTQIDDLNSKNTDLQEIKQNAEVVVISLQKDIKAHQASLITFSQKYKDLLQKEREYNYQQAYIKAMHRSGIPFLILQTYIPDINFEINDNLQGLFDFSVFFELDDKSLDIYFADNSIKSNKRDVALTSGVEGFVINLAIRAALTRISLLPKPSIFMIDEGFSVSDADNLELLKELLTKFRNQYNNIVMITHLDDLKDFPEHYITLQKKNGITSIV
jgi:DNA repair exonuclease SbcCD ATPase subunit